MGQNVTRNWLVPLSGCYSGPYVHSPTTNIDKGLYELGVKSEPSVPPPQKKKKREGQGSAGVEYASNS